MPPAKRASKPAREPAVIGLGVLNEHLGYFVRRLQVWVFQDFIRRLSSIDISPAQFSVLVVISANPGLSQSELAATAGDRARAAGAPAAPAGAARPDATPALLRRRPPPRAAAHARRPKILARAKTLAAQHETVLKDKLGAERHRMLIETLREF